MPQKDEMKHLFILLTNVAYTHFHISNQLALKQHL